MSNRIEEALQTETNGVGLPTVADQAQTTTPESRTHIPLASEIRVTPLDKAQPSNEPPRENQPAEQRETTERSRKTARKSRSPPQPDKAGKVGQARPAKIASPKAPSPPSSKGKKPETVATRKRGASKDAPEAGQESISPSGHDTEAEGASVNITEQNERVQRPSKATKKTQNGEGAAPTTGSEAGKARHPRNRASLDKPADAVESRPASPAEPATQTNEQSSGSSTRRGRQAAKRAGAPPDPEVEGRQRQDSSSELAQAAVKGPKEGKSSARKAAKKAQSQPEHEPEPEIEVEEPEQPEEPEPESQSGPSKSRRGKAGKKDKRATETQPIARKEQPAPAPPEPEVEAEPEPAASGSSTSRRAAGRKATETQTAVTEEEPEQADAAPRRSTRKTREPRGEAVPVTVHRLANTSAFEISHGDFGEDDGSPGDETSAQPKTQLLNRGGVNPADVLSQICRETLEKTLATLKNGIDNETNQSKRAEWTRKRRAVEAFSTELDGRLLDLSEMLDSNFVLGVQLKKSKRDMMDLRGHLYKVRKERESVALQMDAVRAKHMEEENAKTVSLSLISPQSATNTSQARMTINNSLHSLELALDRGQNRAPAEAEPLSATLDFMLRTVADDVSSRAPGAQGGLLNQIRAFNVQLESTARHLERK